VDLVADESSGVLYLTYAKNFFSDDLVEFGVGDKGLLRSATATSVDHSATVVENLVLAGLEVLKAGSGGGLAASSAGAGVVEAAQEIHITFDPTDLADLSGANAELGKVGLELRDSRGATPIAQNPGGSGNSGGLVFRPPRFFHLYEGNQLIATFAVPDPDYRYAVPLSRTAFTSFKSDLTIEDGMLTSVSIDKQSELAAVAGLPLRIIQEIASLPKGILVYRTENINASKGLIEAQASYLEAAESLRATSEIPVSNEASSQP